MMHNTSGFVLSDIIAVVDVTTAEHQLQHPGEKARAIYTFCNEETNRRIDVTAWTNAEGVTSAYTMDGGKYFESDEKIPAEVENAVLDMAKYYLGGKNHEI